jgi:hypothetical protein
MSGAQGNGAARTIATIEDTEITQLFGNSEQFIRRVTEYGERTGARVGFVIPLPADEGDDHRRGGCW